MNSTILVNLQRCIGCWTCPMGCKAVNKLADDEFRITVKTLGSGEGIDHPGGKWPDLRMSWQPVWAKSCTKCAGRVAEGLEPFCVYTCPTRALAWGDEAEAQAAELRSKGFETFELPAYEGTKQGVVYAHKA